MATVNGEPGFTQLEKLNVKQKLLVGGQEITPASGIAIERLVDGLSAAANQDPTGTGDGNAIQIEFGPAQNTGADPVSLEADGSLNINEAGTYRIKVAFQFGRTGGAGTSELLFRVREKGGAQLGRSISIFLDNANANEYFENDEWLTFNSPISLTYEVMRDAAGNNSGGLASFTPSGAWNPSASAALRVYRWIPAT